MTAKTDKLPPLRDIRSGYMLLDGLQMPSQIPLDDIGNMVDALLQVFIDVNEDILLPFSRDDETTELSGGWSITTRGIDELPWHRAIEIAHKDFSEKYFVLVEVRKENSEKGKLALSELHKEEMAELAAAGDDGEDADAVTRLLMKQILRPSEKRQRIEASPDSYLEPGECSRLEAFHLFMGNEMDGNIIEALSGDAYCTSKIFSLKPSSPYDLDEERRYVIGTRTTPRVAEVPVALRLLSEGMAARGFAEPASYKLLKMFDVEYDTYTTGRSVCFYGAGAAAMIVGKGVFDEKAEEVFDHAVGRLVDQQFSQAVGYIEELVPMLKECDHFERESRYSCNDGRTEAYLSGKNLCIETQNGKFLVDLSNRENPKLGFPLTVKCTADTSYEEPRISDLIGKGRLNHTFIRRRDGERVFYESQGDFDVTQRGRRQLAQLADVTLSLESIYCCLQEDMAQRPAAPGM